MMLAGRVVDAAEGQAAGLTSHLVPAGEGQAKAFALAARIAANVPLSNDAVTQAPPRIAAMAQADSLFVESLMSTIVQGDRATRRPSSGCATSWPSAPARSARRADDGALRRRPPSLG